MAAALKEQQAEPVVAMTSLPRPNLMPLEHRNVCWSVHAPQDWTLEAFRARHNDSELWTYVGDQLRPGDHIDVFGHRGLWWASLIVGHIARGQAPLFVLLHAFELPMVERAVDRAGLPEGHRIEFDAQRNTYSAIRDKDGAVLVSGASSWEFARSQLLNHATFRPAALATYR